MKKTLRSVMMASAAMLALGASGQTLETVWDLNIGNEGVTIPGGPAASSRYAAAKDGKFYIVDRPNLTVMSLDDTGATTNIATLPTAGENIATDDAGNIIISAAWAGAGAVKQWHVVPADGGEVVTFDIDWDALGATAGRLDCLGHVVGNVLSDEGGYMWLPSNGTEQVVIAKIVNGVVDEDYTQVTGDTGHSNDNITICQPLYSTVAEIDALMDEEGDLTKSFYIRKRGNTYPYKWGDGDKMQSVNLSGTTEEGYAMKNSTFEGLAIFTLQDVTYYVVPMTTDGTANGRGTVFGVYSEDGTVVAYYDDYMATVASGAFAGSHTQMSFIAEPIDENSVYIYRWIPGKQAAKFKFSVTAETPAELPVATFTFVPDGTTQAEIGLYGTAAGQKVVVDWGDGVKSDSITIADPETDWSATSIVGVPVGDGIVKLYGKVEEIGHLDCSWGTGQLKMQAADVSALTATATIAIVSHELTTIDLSKNVALTSLDLSNNKLTALDLSANTAITKLVLSNSATLGENRMQGIDLSKLTALTNLQVAYNELTSIDLAANTSIATLNLTGNKFETIDLSAFTTIKTLNLPMNNLSEVKLPSAFPAKSYVYIQNNKLKLSTLPVQPENVTRYTYAPQQEVEISVVDGKVDLSSEAMVGENATVFTWYDAEGNELVADADYTAENGVFSFLKDVSVYCTMANAAFANFTGNNILKTTVVDATTSGVEGVAVAAEEVPAVYYNLQGVQVANPVGGLYIVKRGNKVSKELIVK